MVCAVEGLYRDDYRDGPGLLSDVNSGQDDVGFWLRGDLVKLCVSVPDVFEVRDRWPAPIDVDGHRLKVTASGHHGSAVTAGQRLPPVDCPPPPPPAHLLNTRLPADSLAVDRQAFDEAFDAAVDDWSLSWRQQLRQICVGSCRHLTFTLIFKLYS